ncbi:MULTISPECIES: bifunctional TVP38/TMEM64 family protein/FAD-dependent oxidoreductase [unclassified Photobacterium]|uniref:FAD-dependent oxidoreductase n=1 Tax=unclassified Photobacterium TaxID=2628852 RepID=UPI001EDDAC9D|nr:MULTISPECIES: bifunctional TVP38/TMEM64 family protein/FAD-dependent oxidoreductase [unclassified Photobacterium]MCG3863318.1 FAD-dependent oxidoreductase [Photobacterium sp. Ph6]MCG3874848.1 FAD-dependent oxidoreductase [Photobacterium sp. Ph5]
MDKKKLALLIVIISLIVSWVHFDLGQYLTLDFIKQEQSALQAKIQNQPIVVYVSYFAIYVLATALSLPGAAILTLLAAAIFGFWPSLVIVSFASTIGATLAFLSSRFILRDWVQQRFGSRLKTINQGIEKEGEFYLLTLRLIPVFPFFLINLLMGLTPIKTRTFYLISQLGMLPATAIFINAGTQLSNIESLRGIISTPVLLSLALLGIFPLIAKFIVTTIKRKQVYKGFNKPTSFNQNLVVIGAGAGGLVSSYIAAAVKAEVTLIERHKMGGDCLNTGCVPSKALIRVAHSAYELQKAKQFGIEAKIEKIDFKAVMARVHKVIKGIEPHDSVERYSKLGVNCVQGDATILSPWEVEVNGKVITTRNIIIATGASPLLPNISGLNTVDPLTSDNLWQLDTLPEKLLILGGGPIGCELAQAFNRLGASVTLIEMADQLLNREDQDAADLIYQKLTHEGVRVLLKHKAASFTEKGATQYHHVKLDDLTSEQTIDVEFDQVIVALGRVANTKGFGLENLHIATTPQGTIKVNNYLQTQYPNIYAVGDVAGPFQLTHAAAHQAWYASVNSLFGTFKKFKADYSILPAVTYTAPELARVGLNEKEAISQNIDYRTYTYPISDLDRAIADNAAEGFVKVLTPPNSDKILGVTIVGHHGGELLAEFTLAMRYKLGLNKILSTIHPYPTMSEANKYAAGVWKQANAPQKLLAMVKRYHQWMRK